MALREIILFTENGDALAESKDDNATSLSVRVITYSGYLWLSILSISLAVTIFIRPSFLIGRTCFGLQIQCNLHSQLKHIPGFYYLKDHF